MTLATLRLATVTDAADLSRLHASSFDDGWSEADFAVWLARAEGFAVLATRANSPREWEAGMRRLRVAVHKIREASKTH